MCDVPGRVFHRVPCAKELGGRGGGAAHEGHMQSYGSQTDVGVAAGLKFIKAHSPLSVLPQVPVDMAMARTREGGGYGLRCKSKSCLLGHS